MAHAFSVEIHDFLSQKILEAEEGKQAAELNRDTAGFHYFEGRLLELQEMRQYLSDHIDLKTQKYF